MGSNRTGEVNCKIYSEGLETITKTTSNAFSSEINGTPKSKQSSHTPEYVKRTAKLFESVTITEENGVKNGITQKFSLELNENETIKKSEKETIRKISLDCLDGELNKKPSYVGVSCSNSGYRNVINYDSKLREGFRTANNQRESLVLSSSRLRENSPLRREFEFKSRNGTKPDSVNITEVRIENKTTVPVNNLSQPEKFVNISTSTKTISTFRNSKDIKAEELGTDANGVSNRTEAKVNLKQILNGKNYEPSRKGYSNLGFSPKILKSPEKNCNSFLKSISSFEQKSQNLRSSTYTAKTEQKICDSNNSILQRIERLYGPGALAQGFYTQKSPYTKGKDSEKLEDFSLDRGQNETSNSTPSNQPQPSISASVNSTPNSHKSPPTSTPEISEPEKTSNSHETEKSSVAECENGEKSGHHFLKLLKKETDRLEQLASVVESELENGENLPEEISGKLRAAAGKARLLVSQKLRQFEGLCHKNLNEKPGEQFPTTREDLAGFWDMVMLQVVQVYGVFDELEELRKNNWKATPTKKTSPGSVTNGQSQASKVTPKKSNATSPGSEKPNQKSESAKKAREAERKKLLEERRKKMKELKENKIISNDGEVEIFAK